MRALLCVAMVLALGGCAAFEEPLERETVLSLSSPEMEAAIRAANPGVPR